MKSAQQATLPVLLPPSVLRPIAFRIFTRKHSLTVTSKSLQLLATFIGNHCGAGWREDGLAEALLDEIARSWKVAGGGVIVEESQSTSLKSILDGLDSRLSDGRISPIRDSVLESAQTGRKADYQDRDQNTFRCSDASRGDLDMPSPHNDTQQREQNSFGDPGQWLKVISCFDQPRVTYNPNRKDFESSPFSASLLPFPTHIVSAFRDRYNRVYQRVLRNKAFQQASVLSVSPRPQSHSSETLISGNYNLTFVSSLQGRSGTSHLLLGLLQLSPVGEFCLSDLTGSIVLDIQNAKGVPEGGAWFAPGMVLLVDGIYEDDTVGGSQLSGTRGIASTIGGRFIALSIAGPPCERREVTLGINSSSGAGSVSIDGFGWTDFLGVGSERAEGLRMRGIMQQYFQMPSAPTIAGNRTQVVIMNEVNLDNPKTPMILKKVYKKYDLLPADRTPIAFLMIGNFAAHPAVCRGKGTDSIGYKELFDRLALVLSEFPRLLRECIFIFVPGDNDPWSSSFCAGAAVPIPRGPIPDMFTSRIRRVFRAAKEEKHSSEVVAPSAGAVWASNPARLSIFGPVQEVVVFRDDSSERLRRTSLNLDKSSKVCETDEQHNHGTCSPDVSGPSQNAELSRHSQPNPGHSTNPNKGGTTAARKLVKTLLDQAHLSPFSTAVRPVLWDYASALHLYPLPTALILADPGMEPFLTTYEGCHVMNPGKFISENRPEEVAWIEYNILTCKGSIQTMAF